MLQKIKYFTLSEFIKSNTASRLHIDNMPSFDIVDNLNRLAYYLDKVRDKLGLPIIVTSGYRCSQLNKAVGGVANSQHLTGLAADIRCTDMVKLENVICELGGYDQLIKEHYKGNHICWYHVSIPLRGKKPRKRFIRDMEMEKETTYQ